jgi:hypothetical protein
MAAAFFRRCAHIPAFFYYLELKPALIANINFTLSHFMTISHFTNLLSGAQTILTLYYRMGFKGWQVKGNFLRLRGEVVEFSIWQCSDRRVWQKVLPCIWRNGGPYGLSP